MRRVEDLLRNPRRPNSVIRVHCRDMGARKVSWPKYVRLPDGSSPRWIPWLAPTTSLLRGDANCNDEYAFLTEFNFAKLRALGRP